MAVCIFKITYRAVKNNLIVVIFLTFLIAFGSDWAKAQETNGWKLPSTELRDLKNNPIMASELANSEGPTVVNFWATWCKPCIQELNSINEVYFDWQDETNVKLVAISIDDSRNVPKVAPLVNGKGWEFDVFTDANSDFRRAMNVQTIPHTFLLNSDGNVVWQHNGYTPGEEEELFEVIKKVANGEDIN